MRYFSYNGVKNCLFLHFVIEIGQPIFYYHCVASIYRVRKKKHYYNNWDIHDLDLCIHEWPISLYIWKMNVRSKLLKVVLLLYIYCDVDYLVIMVTTFPWLCSNGSSCTQFKRGCVAFVKRLSIFIWGNFTLLIQYW